MKLPAGLPGGRSRASSLLSIACWFAAGLLGCVLLLLVPEPSWARTTSISLGSAIPFCVVGQTTDLHLAGTMAEPADAVTARIRVSGPGRPSSGTGDWPVCAELTVPLGDLAGEFDATVSLPAQALPQAGAFEARVALWAGDTQVGSASAWLAAVAPDQANVDLALVLPLIRGVRQDPSGTFVDSVITETAAPFSSSGRSLYLPASLLGDFPAWHFTLAVEPVVLSQLNARAEGFTEVADGTPKYHGAESAEARQAAEGLAVLQGLAREPGVEIIPTPYAAPALSVLAVQGWGEGLEQMRLGRATLQRVLQPGEMSQGAYAPGLDLTTDCLPCFSRASVDYVVASAAVTKDLAESPVDALLPVRISDNENSRITLMPVSSELSAALGETWDIPRFFAAVASLLADGHPALIVAPADDYAPLDALGLKALGAALSQAEFISTVTLAELLDNHPPSSRPIFLSRFGGHQPGLMAQALIDRIRAVRGPVEDLATAAGEQARPVSAARVALFHAQSRLWLREGADPVYVNLGVAWAQEAGRVVEAEIGAVQVGQVTVTASEEETVDITVAVENKAGQPMSLVFEVMPSEGGGRLTVAERTVEVGSGIVTLDRVAIPSGRHLLATRAGSTQLASVPFSLRREKGTAWWVWAAGALLLCAGGAVGVAARRRRMPTPPTNRESHVKGEPRGPS